MRFQPIMTLAMSATLIVSMLCFLRELRHSARRPNVRHRRG
jgi:hypothetical protein